MRIPTCLFTAVLSVLFAAVSSGADVALRDVIDQEIRSVWQHEELTPPGPADDAAFLRRVYLDLIGIIPSYEETLAFLNDQTKDKRARLIDRLLAHPRFGVHQADVWDLVLFGRIPASNEARTRDGFKRWLVQQFNDNVPYDQWARAILKAEGNTVDQGAPMYLVQYERNPEAATIAITQTFLGVQLQCAQCHDHPFDHWKQTDFYGMAAFLVRLRAVSVGKKGRETKWVVAEHSSGEIMFTGPAADQEPGKKGKPIPPRFLDGSELVEPPLPKDFKEPRNFPSGKMPPKPRFSRKNKLAEWITARDNPYFAKAVANRIWGQFFGRGLVHPVDNLSQNNPSPFSGLLQKTADALRKHNFDLKWYIRELCNTQTYQLACAGPVTEAKPRWFERARVRPLSAEELLESWRLATGYDNVARRAGKKQPDGRFYGVTWGYMLRFFGQPDNGVGDFQGGLSEHLYLNNGELSQLITRESGGLYDAILKSTDPWSKRVERLFLSILNRYPTPAEQKKFVSFLTADDRQSDRLADAIWVLMTCSEFRFNH
ncbi:MAG: hypothetical protein KatS3mg105_2059 [Gemmatales bacterium]|nr:MAG: hypothetical protein KatS3mg105_2059 [Gemmatales bacterium]